MSKPKDDDGEFDSSGLVFLDNQDKVRALDYCVQKGAAEDALGHALDLVERLRHQCRRECRQAYGNKDRDDDFAVKVLRRRMHVRRSYREYRDWLKRTDRKEITAL